MKELVAKSGLDGVMGYHRPVSQFNIGKKQEYKERKFFNENKVINEKKESV